MSEGPEGSKAGLYPTETGGLKVVNRYLIKICDPDSDGMEPGSYEEPWSLIAHDRLQTTSLPITFVHV